MIVTYQETLEAGKNQVITHQYLRALIYSVA
jgi:hypothetical protein